MIKLIVSRISGDRLVASATGSQQWGTTQDVKLTLTYPRSGTGAVVTFIQIPVEQVNIKLNALQ